MSKRKELNRRLNEICKGSSDLSQTLKRIERAIEESGYEVPEGIYGIYCGWTGRNIIQLSSKTYLNISWVKKENGLAEVAAYTC